MADDVPLPDIFTLLTHARPPDFLADIDLTKSMKRQNREIPEIVKI